MIACRLEISRQASLSISFSFSLSVSSYRRRWIRCTNHRPTAFHNWIMLSSFSFFLLLLFFLLFSALCKRKSNRKQEVYYIFINLRITTFFFFISSSKPNLKIYFTFGSYLDFPLFVDRESHLRALTFLFFLFVLHNCDRTVHRSSSNLSITIIVPYIWYTLRTIEP